MAIQKDWKISRRGNKCSQTDVKFDDGESFYTCIFDDPESAGFLRQDFSEAAWAKLDDSFKPFSFWKSICKYPKTEETPVVLENESAETMLRRMIEDDEASTENARYILTLMLERKKTLRPVGVKETDSSRLLLYEHRATGDVLIIRDPLLKLDEVEKVQEEVSHLLDQNTPGKTSNTTDQDQPPSEETPPEVSASDAEPLPAEQLNSE
ncbi:MAG: hypothetical protein GXP30_00220 [Verrucomicrobia bacterium]|nr:hypothetical protein [Verrucomicrobiota bacterium]